MKGSRLEELLRVDIEVPTVGTMAGDGPADQNAAQILVAGVGQ